MAANPPRDADLVDLKRQAFLLDQFNSAAAGKLSRMNANKRIPKQIQEELGLTPSTANDLRTALASQGLLTEQKVKTSVSYSITDAGHAWLQENRRYVPLRTANGKVNPTTDPSIQEKRVAHLLLQLIEVSEGETPTELNKRLGPLKLKLKLNAASARHVRGELADKQLIAVIRTPRSEKYVLTPAGYSYLVALSFDSLGKMTMSGSALTRLLREARKSASTAAKPVSDETSNRSAPLLDQLEAKVMDIFAELRRERYANTGLVPIHEVRSIVGRELGAEAASHARFDEAVKGLRRSRKIGLLSISDRSRATEEQLRDSIVGVGETFFYLENVDDSASG